MTEQSVHTAKLLIRSSPDSYAALLAYRTTPLESDQFRLQTSHPLFTRFLCSPFGLLNYFSWELLLPSSASVQQATPHRLADLDRMMLTEVAWFLENALPQGKRIRNSDESITSCSSQSQRSTPLSMGSIVFLPDWQESGCIISQPACWSYGVSTASDDFQRNRQHVNSLHKTNDPASTTTFITADSPSTQLAQEKPHRRGEQPPLLSSSNLNQPHHPGQALTRSGHVSHPPDRLGYQEVW